MDFKPFAQAVEARFRAMSEHELFVVGDEGFGDALYATYLASFPDGTNPLYKTRTEHDCACCRHFIRNLGRVVAVVDGHIKTVWDITTPGFGEGVDYAYLTVARAMGDRVRNAEISALFRTKEHSYGTAHTKQLLASGMVKTWDHFHGKVAARHCIPNPDAARGQYATTVQVFRRGLDELTLGAMDTVIELIGAKSLYRGEEHLPAVQEFREAQARYRAMTARQREVFAWTGAESRAARFRNTAIGTLVQDLSAGVELEAAVRSFESKVAPTNYKRTTALITPRMVEDAMRTIREMGLEPALERRFARLTDIAVNNVLWVDRSVAGRMKGGVEGLLMKAAAASPSTAPRDAQDIGVEEFFRRVLPQAVSMELFVANAMTPNFVSITAPVHPDAPRDLFRWDNGFGWSYDGNITDSIKERVKKAGGNVTNAKLRVSLAWFNYDDLDLHVVEPDGNRICFYAKRSPRTGGFLDVDMNVSPRTREAVENVSWAHELPDGRYRVIVDQYNRRETDDVGCTIEIEHAGKIVQLSHPQALRGETHIADLSVKGGVVVDMKAAPGVLAGHGLSQQKWGIQTETFVPVQTLMYSPNHWDDQAVGNRHWFFILKDCRNDAPTRGIYNEFLNPRLEKHRKVFEVLGAKTMCQPTDDDQLSGLGFSSTRNDAVTVRVNGYKTSTFNIHF